MLDVLLLNPNLYDTTKLGKLDCDEHWSPPLGIAYIAATLSKAGFKVDACDLYYKEFAETEKILRNNPARIIGIACFSEQRTSAFRIVNYIRQYDKDVKIVIGGPHTNFLYEQVLLNYDIDAILLGESEKSMTELVSCFLNNGDLEKVKGIAFKKGSEVCVTEKRDLIKDLDEIPFPDYKYFENDKYASIPWFKDLTVDGSPLKEMKWTCIIASRGCAFNCSFCSTPKFWQRNWRKRSPENVVDEIEFLVKHYGYEFIDFSDDILTLNRQWVIEICNGIINRKLNVLWCCCTRADTIDIELLKIMKKAGCVMVALGIESFSPLLLKNMNKKVTQEKLYSACNLVQDAGIALEMLLIIGNRGETEASIDETAYFIEKIDPFAIAPSILTIFPGTALYDDAKKNDFINDDYWLSDKPCPYDTREHDLETLKKWYEKISSICESESPLRPDELQ